METFLTFAVNLTIGIGFWTVVFATYKMLAMTFSTLMRAANDPLGWSGLAAKWAAGLATPFVLVAASLLAANAYEPAPTRFDYATVEKNPEAGFWTRTAAWAALGTGWISGDVTSRGLYTKAVVDTGTEQVHYVGLPGVGKFYTVNKSVYDVL